MASSRESTRDYTLFPDLFFEFTPSLHFNCVKQFFFHNSKRLIGFVNILTTTLHLTTTNCFETQTNSGCVARHSALTSQLKRSAVTFSHLQHTRPALNARYAPLATPTQVRSASISPHSSRCGHYGAVRCGVVRSLCWPARRRWKMICGKCENCMLKLHFYTDFTDKSQHLHNVNSNNNNDSCIKALATRHALALLHCCSLVTISKKQQQRNRATPHISAKASVNQSNAAFKFIIKKQHEYALLRVEVWLCICVCVCVC